MILRTLMLLVLLSLVGKPARATPLEFVTQLGHSNRLLSLAISGDGTYALSGSLDGSVRLWHLPSGVLLRSFAIRGWPHAQFLPGARAITGSGAGSGGFGLTIQVWDLATGKLLHGFGAATSKLSLSADGKRVAAFTDKLTVWEVASGTIVYQRDKTPEGVRDFALSPDGKHLAVVGSDKMIRILDATTGVVIKKLEGYDSTSLAFSPSGKTVVVTLSDRTLLLVNVTTGKLVWKTTDAAIGPVRFSQDGNRILTNDVRTAAVMWDASTGMKLNSFFVLKQDRNVSALSPDGNQVLVSEGPAIKVYDSSSIKPIPLIWNREIQGRIVEGFAAAFSPDGKRLFAASGKHAFAEWELDSLRRVRSFTAHAMVRDVAVSPDGKTIASGTGGFTNFEVFTGYLWEAVTGRQLHELPGHDKAVTSVAFSPDGRKLVTASEDYALRVWDPATGSKLKTITLASREPLVHDAWRSVRFFPDGKRIVAGSFESGGTEHAIRIFDIDSGQLVQTLGGHNSEVHRVAVSPDGKRVLSGHVDRYARLWDPDTGTLVATLDHKASVTAVTFTPDGKHAITGAADNSIRIWDLQTNTVVRRLQGHLSTVQGVQVSPDGRFLLSASRDGTNRLWRLDTGVWVALVAIDNEWIVYDEAGRFDASRKGGDLVTVVQGMKAFRADQLAAVKNRPDLILEAMGLGTRELREHFRVRAQRRTKYLGVADDALEGASDRAPDANIVNATQQDHTVTITTELTARGTATLLRYNIYVNDVPLFGALGKSVTGSTTSVTDTVALTYGTNRVEVAVINTEGVESLRAMRTFPVHKATPRRLYFLGFGVSRYRDTSLNLSYAHKDALDLAHLFKSAKGFEQVRVKTFVNEEVTVAAIRGARDFLTDARAHDLVVVFVAGHGTHALDAAAQYYFISHETDPKRLAETAADFGLIEELMLATPARQKLLLLDTCESGERDEHDEATVVALAGQRGLRSRSTRALVRTTTPTAPRKHLFDRERFIYNDLARRSGAIVFSASRGAELSFELAALENGAFTDAFVAALTTDEADTNKDGSVSSDELRAYVSAAVAKRTGDLQHPVVDRDNPDQLITFGISRNLVFPAVAAVETAAVETAAIVSIVVPVPPPTKIVPTQRGPRGCACGIGRSDEDVLGLFSIAVALAFACRRRFRAAGRRRRRA